MRGNVGHSGYGALSFRPFGRPSFRPLDDWNLVARALPRAVWGIFIFEDRKGAEPSGLVGGNARSSLGGRLESLGLRPGRVVGALGFLVNREEVSKRASVHDRSWIPEVSERAVWDPFWEQDGGLGPQNDLGRHRPGSCVLDGAVLGGMYLKLKESETVHGVRRCACPALMGPPNGPADCRDAGAASTCP